MRRLGAESLVRMMLLVSVAASHLTLLLRAGFADFTIMAALSWFAGGLLLLEREQEIPGVPPLSSLPRRNVLVGNGLLLWCLLVLSLVARLYDPLLHLLPLAALVGLALLSGQRWASPPLATLALIGALLPAQVLLNRFLPDGPVALMTAQATGLLLWGLGRPAVSDGIKVLLPDRALVVGESCTGINTLVLCLAAALVLVILLPPPRARSRGQGNPWRSGLGFGAAAVVMAFLVNLARIVLLAYADITPGLNGLARLRGFAFWHDGPGSNLFSLAAMTLVCLVWVLFLEVSLRTVRFLERKSP